MIISVVLAVPLSGCGLTQQQKDRKAHDQEEIIRATEGSERHLDDRDAALREVEDHYKPSWTHFVFEWISS